MSFIQEDKYIGNQAILNSGRLIFNGKDDVIFSSKNRFLFKTDGDFHLNTKKSIFIINKPDTKIHIGAAGPDGLPNIPAVRSTELTELLMDLIDALDSWFSFEYPLTSGAKGGGAVPETNRALTNNVLSELVRIRYALEEGYINSENILIR